MNKQFLSRSKRLIQLTGHNACPCRRKDLCVCVVWLTAYWFAISQLNNTENFICGMVPNVHSVVYPSFHHRFHCRLLWDGEWTFTGNSPPFTVGLLTHFRVSVEVCGCDVPLFRLQHRCMARVIQGINESNPSPFSWPVFLSFPRLCTLYEFRRQ
jgi:hypothetical protein